MTATRFRYGVVVLLFVITVVNYIDRAAINGRRPASGLWISPSPWRVSSPSLTGWVLDIRGSFSDGFLLMAVLAASPVLQVLVFHNPDRDRVIEQT